LDLREFLGLGERLRGDRRTNLWRGTERWRCARRRGCRDRGRRDRLLFVAAARRGGSKDAERRLDEELSSCIQGRSPIVARSTKNSH